MVGLAEVSRREQVWSSVGGNHNWILARADQLEWTQRLTEVPVQVGGRWRCLGQCLMPICPGRAALVPGQHSSVEWRPVGRMPGTKGTLHHSLNNNNKNNNNNNKHLYSACSTECAHRRFTVNYYYYPWSIGLETNIYHHSPSAKHTLPAAYMVLVELFNHTISFTARPGSTSR